MVYLYPDLPLVKLALGHKDPFERSLFLLKSEGERNEIVLNQNKKTSSRLTYENTVYPSRVEMNTSQMQMEPKCNRQFDSY